MPEQKVPNINQLWDNVLTEIELSVSRPNFTTWFKNTELVKEEDGIVYIGVPNTFVKGWLEDKYHKMILKLLRSLSENVRNVEYVIISRATDRQKLAQPGAPVANRNELPLGDLYVNKEDNLNPKYTFDSFVVGPFNEVVYAAAQAVVRNPGKAYNPLFIYGGTGLGKTHLLQAIGNTVKSAMADKKVYYITSEKFFLDYTNAVGANNIGGFKEKYRKYDVFIMDDIQFLAKKKATQDELFHLFNTLYDNNKQIVFSSDKHYNYIPELEDRLRSRFGAGMIIDVAEPDFESRIAILREKIKSQDFPLADEVIEYLAHTVQGSIRELEGTLNVLACQTDLKKRDLGLNEVKTLIRNAERPKKTASVESIISVVSEFYNIDKEFIYQKTRRKEVVKPRQIVMYLLREEFSVSYPTIGQKLGGRDHTTVIHSCEKVKENMKTDQNLYQEIEQLKAMF